MTASAAPGREIHARFTVSVLDSAFVDIILGSLQHADASRVAVTTGDISTLVSGRSDDVLTYVRDVVAGAASGGIHVSVTLAIGGAGTDTARLALEPTGLRARAHWSLPATGADRAITLARELGTWSGDDPLATRLDGDLSDVLETIAKGGLLTGGDEDSPTTHATIALNSPSTIRDDA